MYYPPATFDDDMSSGFCFKSADMHPHILITPDCRDCVSMSKNVQAVKAAQMVLSARMKCPVC